MRSPRTAPRIKSIEAHNNRFRRFEKQTHQTWSRFHLTENRTLLTGFYWPAPKHVCSKRVRPYTRGLGTEGVVFRISPLRVGPEYLGVFAYSFGPPLIYQPLMVNTTRWALAAPVRPIHTGCRCSNCCQTKHQKQRNCRPEHRRWPD